MMTHSAKMEKFYVCDAKALSDENYKLWRTYGFERFDKYAWQLSIYAYATRADGICMAVYNKATGELDVSFHKPPYSFADMVERTLKIEALVNSDSADLPPCEPDLFFCAFQYLHDTMFDDVELSGGMEQLRQNELWELAAKYEQAKRSEKRYANLASETLHEIEIKLKRAEKSVRVRKTGASKPFNITRVDSTRRSIDKEQLGGYLQGVGRSLTEFERSETISYIRVSAVRKKKEGEEGSDGTTTTS
jgi:hypothetical protein